jgi:LVIVD repeat
MFEDTLAIELLLDQAYTGLESGDSFPHQLLSLRSRQTVRSTGQSIAPKRGPTTTLLERGWNMALIVVAASTKSPDFAVVDFTQSPPKSVLVGASSGGNVVDCYGKLAAVGDWGSGTVTLFDISNPESPLINGSVNTGLSSITAISIDGAHVLAAGPKSRSDAELVLISIGNPKSPQVVSTYGHTGVTGTQSISGVVIRGKNALSCQTYGCLVMDYANASHPSGVGYPASSSPINLNGQVVGDFDGTNAVITAPPSDWNGTQPIDVYLFKITNGTGSQPPKSMNMGGQLFSSVAIAEIPEGGRYLATATLSEVGIQAFPDGLPNASTGFFVPELGTPNAAVAIKFLNNPAIAPLLAVANVTNEHGFLITASFLVLESNGQTSTLTRATPNPVATVGLAPTLNPTLGITGWTD